MVSAKEKERALADSAQRRASWITRPRDEIVAAFEALQHRPGFAFRNQGQLSVDDMARILDASDEVADSKPEE